MIEIGGTIAGPNDPADEVMEPDAVVDFATGYLWLLDQHCIVCGLTIEAAVWEQLMEDRIADMAFEDGPFNMLINGHLSDTGRFAELAMASGEMSIDEFVAFQTTAMHELCHYLNVRLGKNVRYRTNVWTMPT